MGNDRAANEVKYLKQIKNMSLRLTETINVRVSGKIRGIPNFHFFILNARELELIRGIQNSIINAKSIKEIITVLSDY